MFSFVLVSHPSCAVFRWFALYLAPVLIVFVCVFLYWVRPLVILLTFAASVFRVGYIQLGAPFWRLTRPSRRSLRGKLKKFSLRGFLGVRPSGTSPDPRVGPLGRGVNTSPWGENKPGSSASSLLHGKTRTRKNWSCILSNLKTKGKNFLCINLEKHLT